MPKMVSGFDADACGARLKEIDQELIDRLGVDTLAIRDAFTHTPTPRRFVPSLQPSRPATPASSPAWDGLAERREIALERDSSLIEVLR
jgi:hypothetical protein